MHQRVNGRQVQLKSSSSETQRAPRYIGAALLFVFSAGAIVYDAQRQAVPPLLSLQAIERSDIQDSNTAENFGIPAIRDEYVALKLRDGSTVRYREWYPHYAEVKAALLSPQPVRVWISRSDHYRSIYQVEAAGRIVASYDSVSTRVQRNSTLIVLLALVMAFLLAPYCLWKAWRINRTGGKK